ncbi:MAG: tripartite tricarboxylate transporter TctB family protein [Tistlia sp.]|uniref:tripartite tricarboxylate transporter TctB family protein n=1 Tax=Tistlia sp. TaxID=3057121 RepID=UPI0034A515B7
MRFNDTVLGLVLAALGGVVVWQAGGFPSRPGMIFGPALFPTIIGLGLVGCGLLLVARKLLAGDPTPWWVVPDWGRSLYHVAGIPVVIGLILFYLYLSRPLGFVPTMFLVLLAGMLWFRARLLPAVATAAGGAVGIFVGFSLLLRVPLPVGPLERLLW